jgi:hypothetical protein
LLECSEAKVNTVTVARLNLKASVQNVGNATDRDVYVKVKNKAATSIMRVWKSRVAAVSCSGLASLGSVPGKCSVCLSCGSNAPYLDSVELEKVRTWKKKKKVRSVKGTVDGL